MELIGTLFSYSVTLWLGMMALGAVTMAGVAAWRAIRDREDD